MFVFSAWTAEASGKWAGHMVLDGPKVLKRARHFCDPQGQKWSKIQVQSISGISVQKSGADINGVRFWRVCHGHKTEDANQPYGKK